MEILLLLGLGLVASFAAIGVAKASSSSSTPPLQHPTTFQPAAKKTTSDAELKAKACAAANSYVATLRKAGLPAPPNWDKLNCDQKIAATATIVGGGSLTGMIQAAAAATAAINAGSIGNQAKAVVDRWTGGRL